jgi:hypothetical protein
MPQLGGKLAMGKMRLRSHEDGIEIFEGDKRSYQLAIALDDFFPSDP